MLTKVKNSTKYQLLIADIKEVNEKIKTIRNGDELQKLISKRSELLQIKSTYSNIEHIIQAIKEIAAE